MRIAISARGLQFKSGGAKEYIAALARTLPAIDLTNDYYLYYSHPSQRLNISLSNVHEIVLPALPTLFWDHIILPLQILKDKIDVTLYPKCTVPLVSSGRKVVSVLDLGYFYPGLKAYKLFDTLYMKYMIPRAIRKADAILAISDYTRRDIHLQVPDVPDSKIRVTYLAPALDCVEDEEISANLPDGPFIFMSSSLSPRKNIERCIYAVAQAKHRIPHKFVITGGNKWGNSTVAKLAKQLGIEDRFVTLGHVTKADLGRLYKTAAFYLMPSLYEGFGITLLEAMEQGCPVAVSNITSHPEVVGSAAVMFDPYSVDDIEAAIIQLATNSELRSRLVEEGYKQAAKFSWERCARETAVVLHEVAAND